MTDQEREIVLKMIEDGKISPEEGLKLMNALKSSAEVETPPAGPNTGSGSGPAGGAAGERSGLEADPRIARVKSTARRLWQVPLWIGVGVTVLSAAGMYFILRGTGMNFWFYCLSLPLLLGIVVMAAAVGSRKARWLFVDVHQKPGEKPGRIFLGFPLPLKLTAWGLRTFGHKIPDLKNTSVDEVLQVVETGLSGDEPLIVNVDEGEDGERVQVYIG
ncbi:MAG: hypothetical protein FD146_1328 [Anaerolineaceae bacterium]|nr:MAG: hypothetical protein FD146_1328 [Anaerolineaceae bacterium]